MNYTFQWGVVLKSMPEMLAGVVVTLQLATIAFVLSVVLSIILALFARSNSKTLRWINILWVEIGRNTPALFQIYMIYFGLGSLGLRIDSSAALVTGITFNATSYLTEIFRGGMKGIPETQHRAARSLGMSATTTFISIELPQLFRLVYYPMSNIMIWCILMTSLGVVVGLHNDLMGVTQSFNVVTFRTFEYFAAAAVMYYLLVKFIFVAVRIIAIPLFRY